MISKWIGAFLVFFSCAGCGFSLAASYRNEEKMYRSLNQVLTYMKAELQFRLTSLPELCEFAANETDGQIRDIFLKLSEELKTWTCPDVTSCMRNVLKIHTEISPQIKHILLDLSKVMGRFDLNGQLEGLDMIKKKCQLSLEGLNNHRDERLRGYQTLGLCAGTALVILFI